MTPVAAHPHEGRRSHSFRRALLTGIAALIAGLLAATGAAVFVVVDRNARRDATDALERSRLVFEELSAYRQALFRTEARVVAEEPRVKAVVASDETTAETVHGVLVEMKRAIKSDVLLLTDEQGRLVADVADVSATGADLSQNAVVKAALSSPDGEHAGVWVDGQAAVQVHARRMQFGDTVVGVLVVGHRLDDAVAQTVSLQTGSGIAVLLDGRVIARGGLDAELDDPAWLFRTSPFPGYQGREKLEYVVGRSLDRALETARQLLWWLAGILLGSGALALVFAARLSTRLSRPIAELTALSKRIAAGDLSARAHPEGPTEVVSLGGALNQMAADLETSRAALLDKQRLEQEMEIAAKLQTSLLPRKLGVPSLEIAARMLPATQVGGDYYDVIPTKDGAWIGVGDVAGHGLTAGVIMLMLQNLITALVKARAELTPRELVCMLNETLFENVRVRLERSEFTTLSMLRYFADGRVVWAGAHEVALLFRAAGHCEELPNPGTWVGAMRDVSRFTVDSQTRLLAGDLLVLYTDGVSESATAKGLQFGIEGIKAAVEASRAGSVEVIRDAVLDSAKAFGHRQDDDMTVLVLRYVP